MNWQTAIPLIVTVVLAFVGYLVTYFRSLKLAQRKELLEHTQKQLRLLYGPLYGLINSSSTVYREFVAAERPGKKYYWDKDDPPNDEQAAKWRHWITEIFMPMNAKMVEIILENSDLIEEDEMRQCFRDLCAHYYGYQAILKAWDANDFSQHLSLLHFPGQEIHDYVESRFQILKKRQAEITNKRTA